MWGVQGVKIETDEKATKAMTNSAIDDEGVIQELGEKLVSGMKSLAPGFKMMPIQFEKVRSREHWWDVHGAEWGEFCHY